MYETANPGKYKLDVVRTSSHPVLRHEDTILHRYARDVAQMDSQWAVMLVDTVPEPLHDAIRTYIGGCVWDERVGVVPSAPLLPGWSFSHMPLKPSFSVARIIERSHADFKNSFKHAFISEYTPKSRAFAPAFVKGRLTRPDAFPLDQFQKITRTRAYMELIWWDLRADITDNRDGGVGPCIAEWEEKVSDVVGLCEGLAKV